MNGNDTFLDVNNAHLRVTSGNVYASAFNLDQIDIVMSSNTASTVNFNNPTKAFNAASNIEVGTANLFVDTVNSRVGVGTASPATTLDVAGDLNVSGNLTIIGTRTTLDTEHLMVKDPIIELGKGNTTLPGVDLGLILTRPATTSNVGIIFDESESTLEIGYTQGNASDSTITMQSAATEPLSVNVNGTISGNGSGLTALNATNITTGTLDRNTTGSAATLTTPRSIGGVNFDGSADIVPTTFGAATFDTDTLVVDTVNSRVGIGTTSPTAKLEVHNSGAAAGIGDLVADFTGSWIRIGDARSSRTFSEGSGIKFHDAGVAHYSVGQLDGKFKISVSSGDGDSLFPSGYTEGITLNTSGNVGIGTDDPDGTLHVKAENRMHITSGNTPAFTGLDAATSANGRAQLVLSSAYSDLVIASSFVNNSHGSTLSFTTVNPSNTAEYRKFVINQGNWGDRKDFLDFGLSASTADANPHLSINSTDTVLTLDGNNKRVGIGTTSPSYKLHVSAGDDSISYYGPNTTWSSYLAVGAGDDKTVAGDTTIAQCITTNGNLHLDGADSRSIYLNHYSGTTVYYQSTVIHGSDDRLKSDEELITNATETLLKLSPQKYKKAYTLREDDSREPFVESGLMAQDVWYDAPELRHLVHLGADANPTDTKPVAPVDGDIQQDPDYSSWGTETAALNYDGLIAYLIKSNQELHARIQALENT